MKFILNFWIFKLSDIDQGIQKHAIQKKSEISVFLKKKLSEKKKLLLSYLELRYAHKKNCRHNFFSENVCLRTKLDLQLKKITKKNLRTSFQNH